AQRTVSADGPAVAAGMDVVVADDSDGLVVRESAVGDGETPVVVDRAPFRRSVARTEALELEEGVRGAIRRADGLIANERRAADVGGAAAGGAGLNPQGPAHHRGLVVAEDVVVEVDGGADLVQDPAPALLGGVRRARRGAVGDGQTVDGYGRVVADVEDPAGFVAADRQLAGARPVDGHVASEIQLAGSQGDGALKVGGEVDDGAGSGVGGSDRGP